MNTEQFLNERSGNKCELCSSADSLQAYEIPYSPADINEQDKNIYICKVCKKHLVKKDSDNINHWRCINDSMWSSIPAVQVMSWRILNSIKGEGWPQDLLDMFYFDDNLKKWAEEGLTNIDEADIPTKDSNGTQLHSGDTVTLIKDLVVKGANFTAKRGTVVKNISLTSNPKHIEGRVNGTRIVLISAFLKKVT